MYNYLQGQASDKVSNEVGLEVVYRDVLRFQVDIFVFMFDVAGVELGAQVQKSYGVRE